MGKVRELAVLQPCPVCLAGRAQPCKHKVTGRPLSKLHFGRTYGPAENLLNRSVAKIEGGAANSCSNEELMKFFWVALGGVADKYPGHSDKGEWDEFYAKHSDYDPGNQYHGMF